MRLPQTDQSDCQNEAVQAAERSACHIYRDAGACPGHGNPHSCASQSSFVPAERLKSGFNRKSVVKLLFGQCSPL